MSHNENYYIFEKINEKKRERWIGFLLLYIDRHSNENIRQKHTFSLLFCCCKETNSNRNYTEMESIFNNQRNKKKKLSNPKLFLS